LRTQLNREVKPLRAERPPLPIQIVFLGRQLDRLLERRLAEQGLNRTQAMVLVTLSRKPGLKALELCPHARVEPANVTRTLQSLERLGLLERRSHPTDGRASLFYLTASGEETAGSLVREMEKLSEDLFGTVDQREIDALERSLGALRRAVGSQLSAASCQEEQEENLQYRDALKADG
jgi:MarR family transcriptional regulator, transcriptional regulator for hemolysin